MRRRLIMVAFLLALLLPHVLPAAADSLLAVSPTLELRGHREWSTQRLRRLLGAGQTLDPRRWQERLDSLALVYAEAGRPFLDWTLQVDSTATPPRLLVLELDEGPRLVMGRLWLDPPRPELPDPALDLPPGAVLRDGRLEEGLRAWLQRLAARGRPLAQLQIREITLAPGPGAEASELSLDLRAALADADTIRPGRLVVLDAGLTRQLTFERLARLKAGAPYDPARVADARRRLLATGWFSTLEGPALCRTPDGLAWLLRAEELPSYRFDGLLAWLPGRSGEAGRLGYHFSLDLANLMGTGRAMEILASRPEGWSQQVRVAYREPFVLGWPVDAAFSLGQRVQDSTWVEQELGLALGWEPRPGWRLSGALLRRDLAPDSLNGYHGAGIDASRALEWRLGGGIDRRDDPRNPRLGWRAAAEEALVQRRTESLRGLSPRGADLDLHRQRFEGAVWLPAGRRQVAHVAVGAGRFRGSDVPGREDQFLLGGLAGPRGTRDEGIRAREWVLLQLEWRLLLGPAARAALFWDGLLWRDDALTRHETQGRGAALVLPIRQGQLELQYALPPGSAWREGLLHVRLINRF
jgi:outer membrane protein assembly factor BamA